MSTLLQRRVHQETSNKLAENQDKIIESKESSLLQSLISGYKSTTSSECKSIDAFLLFSIMTGVSQMIYCLLTKGFPYNAFIGVFSASVGCFVFAGKLN